MKRIAIVTGGVGALGSAVVRAFAEAGYEVHATATRATGAGPGGASMHVVDLAAQDAVRRFAAQFGEVHALALCAGGFAMAPLAALDEAGLDAMMNLNFKTSALILAALTPKLKAGSAAVLVGSQAYEGAAGKAAYAASKAAVVSLAKSAAFELKSAGVRVNAVLPDTIDTEANRLAMPQADFTQWAKPEELARVVVWLCSPDAQIISGNAITVGR